MLCPRCSESFQQLQADDLNKGKIVFFRCPKCSGIWLDGIDQAFSRLSHNSALRIDSVVRLEEIAVSPRRMEISCPRCKIHLTERTGGHLPKGLHLDYCSTCRGLWFDKGELLLYKNHLHKSGRKNPQELKSGDQFDGMLFAAEVAIDVLLSILMDTW